MSEIRSELLRTTAKVPDGTLGGRLKPFFYQGTSHDDQWLHEIVDIDGKPTHIMSQYCRAPTPSQ